MNSIKESVLGRIERGEVSMHSRAYFLLKSGTIALLIVLAAVLAAFVASFAFFSIRESGEQFLLGFGMRGLTTFLALFPWITLALLALLLLAIGLLSRRFKVGYRTPVALAFGAVLLGALLLGFGLSRTGLHSFLLEQADRDALPLLGGWYESVRTPHHETGVYRGVVESVATSTFTMRHDDHDRDGDEGPHTVIVPPGFDTGTLTPGERVFVAGGAQAKALSTSSALEALSGGTIEAYGVGEFED